MRCDTCKIQQLAIANEEPACCEWYMDNVICGDKNPEDCPVYKKNRQKKRKDE